MKFDPVSSHPKLTSDLTQALFMACNYTSGIMQSLSELIRQQTQLERRDLGFCPSTCQPHLMSDTELWNAHASMEQWNRDYLCLCKEAEKLRSFIDAVSTALLRIHERASQEFAVEHQTRARGGAVMLALFAQKEETKHTWQGFWQTCYPVNEFIEYAYMYEANICSTKERLWDEIVLRGPHEQE